MPGSQIPPAPPPSGSFWVAPLLGVTVPDSPIFSAADTARLLGFPTREALAKARRTGRLSIKMFQIPGRRGWFARPPYDRLLWRVQGVERCSLHKLRLRRNCPHCESGQTKDSSKVEPDQCSTCGQSLASLTSIRDYSPRPLFGEEQTEQLILRLGELRGADSGSLRVFPRNLSSPAKDWGKHLGDIFHTRQCPILPQLTSLIAVATHFGVDIVQLITSPASAAAQSGLEIGKASPRKMRRPSSHLRANRTAWFRKELEAALAGGPPYPSTAQFCRSRDYSATAARNSFPWLTGQLSVCIVSAAELS